MWGVVVLVLFAIVLVLLYLLWKQSNQSKEADLDLEFDTSNMSDKEKMDNKFANFNFLFDFPEIEKYEEAKAAHLKDAADKEKKNNCSRFLMNRCVLLMQKADTFNKAAPHIAQEKKMEMCTETRWNNFTEAKNMLEAESENIKREADFLNPGWGERIFPETMRLQQQHALSQINQQRAAQGQPPLTLEQAFGGPPQPRQAPSAHGHSHGGVACDGSHGASAPVSPAAAAPSLSSPPQEAAKTQHKPKPHNHNNGGRKEKLQAQYAAKQTQKSVLNPEEPAKPSKAQLEKQKADADRVLRELVREEEAQAAKKKKVASPAPPSITRSPSVADELD